MKTNLFYGIVAVAIFIGVVACCEKEMDEIVPIQDEQEGQDTPPKEDMTYVIDTTKKITIDEIIYFEEDKFMVVGTGMWRSVAYGDGMWVAVGDGGKITTSTDNGTSWTAPQTSSSLWMGIAIKTD
jgi:hypothetical protein